MTRRECGRCGRNAYRDGVCYADRITKGIPIKEYISCAWAKPPLRKTKTK